MDLIINYTEDGFAVRAGEILTFGGVKVVMDELPVGIYALDEI